MERHCAYDITFVQGLPSSELIKSLSKSCCHSLIIIDDLMSTANDSATIQSLFTEGSHHMNISVIFVKQNLFSEGKYARTIALNTHIYILMKNPRNILQIQTLGSQVYGKKSKALVEAYTDCMKVKYNYLILDLHPKTEESHRMRTNVFPNEEDTIIYIPL